MTFSVKTLMLCTLILAILLALYPLLGGDLALGLGFSFLMFAGAESHRVKQPRPFWMAVGALAIFCYLLSPPLGYRPSELDAIVNSIVFTVGGYLAYAGIRSGHWSSRLLAGTVLLSYILVLLFAAHQCYSNWDTVQSYWRQ